MLFLPSLENFGMNTPKTCLTMQRIIQNRNADSQKSHTVKARNGDTGDKNRLHLTVTDPL